MGAVAQWRAAAAAVALLGVPMVAHAQFATVGAGVLLSDRSPEPVFELHAATPPAGGIRAYTTLSWGDESAKPVVITAAERMVLSAARATVGLGAGLLWLEANDYRPYPILVSSAAFPLTIPRTAIVAIGSTQPFQDMRWSVVLKASVMLWSAE